ncbi:uncharacterized protein FOMMEDRAFT_154618 [Fomitiporia mediterranea MF3/22]|uniref:uncharacterized protein n=1 Tax=Fomitiporia mediterranea (strain MF3/22) TaxID=694068 RepID=UPI0004409481|nr:uncharacterized protein FOMMEDRAFT_154618 [Fomitiporia mediterranea MF3/22]EJD03542.1 hypothetical protein FOMMEDRAFT_154618 [Fomitiporia mediterranea MF3/22]
MIASQSNTKASSNREEALRAEIASLHALLGETEGADKIVTKHIKLLHDYNEAKDAAQIIIGKLAMRKETTIKQLHEQYGLSKDD